MIYKDYLRVIRHDNLCTLAECIVTEIKLGKKSISFLLAIIDLLVKLHMN